MDAKLEANMGTIVSTKHGTNCVTTKVDVMVDAKKEENEDVKRNAKVDVNMGKIMDTKQDAKVDATRFDAKVDAK